VYCGAAPPSSGLFASPVEASGEHSAFVLLACNKFLTCIQLYTTSYPPQLFVLAFLHALLSANPFEPFHACLYVAFFVTVRPGIIEIYKMYKNVSLSTFIRLKRLMWAGHVVRMKQHRIPKMVLGRCFGGGRPVGRPRNRWEDVIQRDAATLPRIRNWKAAARDKEKWRKKVREAMARKRAEAP